MESSYEKPIESSRRPWQRRIEVYSPKLKRRVTLFSWAAHDAWLLLESDPAVKGFCERPAYLEGKTGRLIDFGSVTESCCVVWPQSEFLGIRRH
jgi:hypothetical protein